ncbi:pre-peptidase C-terminal domain-containing protein [bacterium]|nr:pre-peptidase C-terminal domain-containing protein [bacterium]
MNIRTCFCALLILLQPAMAMASASDTAKINAINDYLLGKSSDATGLNINGDSSVDIADVVFAIQHKAPTINAFSINNGASTASNRTVTLNNTCSTTPSLYMASESSSFSGASWKTWSKSPSFTLGDGNVTKRVYFKVKNAYGMESDAVNDSIALQEVVTLTVGASAVTAKLSPAGDNDWFKFVVSSTSTYVIETWPGTLADNVMTLYGPNSMTTQIATDYNSGTGSAARIAMTLQSGTYYVKIRADNNSDTGNYTIRVTNIGALKVSSFSINSGDDVATTRVVTLNNKCAGAPTHYMASESSSFSGASWHGYSTAPTFTLSSGNGTKKVYFKVKDLGGAESATVSDSITYNEMTMLPADGTVVAGNISKSTEKDWYILKIDTDGIYTIETSEGSLVDTSLGLTDVTNPGDDDWIASSTDISTTNLMSRVVCWIKAGTYYVRVTSGDGSTGSYTIRAWETSTTKLTVNGSEITGIIDNAGDEDWYRFTVSSAGTYSIQSTEGSLEYGIMEIYTSSFDMVAIAYHGLGPSSTAMPVITAALSSGEYIIRFAGLTDGDTGDYTIQVASGAVSGVPVSLMVNGPTGGGSVSTTSEVDYFQFIANDSDSYTIESSVGTLMAGYMTLRNSSLSVIDYSYSMITGQMPYLNDEDLDTGIYYVTMQSYLSQVGSYKVKVKK